MALNKTLSFDLELKPGGIPPIIHASQGDIGRMFKANIYWDGAAATSYISGATVNLRGKKPDKTVFDYTATLAGSMVTFETTEQMTIISGPVECELVFSNDGDIIASANFVLMVEDSPYNPDAPSESVVPGIEDLIEQTIGGDVSDEVDAWLDAHPEVTTTVQDGAITKAKINTVFLPEIENAYVTPEMFGVVGTDADLLEYAINNLADGGVLMLDKDYTLDRVITLTRLSSRKRITIMPLSENAKINMNGYYITGTENGNTGNILFFGVQFNGASTGIFDGDKLVRLYFLGCNFTSTGSIVFSLSNRARAYFQSIHFLQCTFRHVSDYLIKLNYDTATRLFDISIENSLLEWCEAGIMSANTWYGVTINNNCIEGFTTTEPLFKGMHASNGFTVSNNYFESLNTVYFDFSTYTYRNPFVFAFENNSVVESTVMSIFSMPPKNGGSGSVFKISGNSFMTDADNANKVTVFDVSNTTEKLDKWVIIGNQNFNGYMIWTNDTNNYIQSYSTIYTLLKSLEQTNGLVDMTPGSKKLITIYTTGNAITRSQLVIPITFPFIAPNTNYTYTVRNLAITGISSNADVTLISKDGQFDSGMDLRYIDTTNSPFTANIPYSVRIRLYITFG